MASIPRPAHPMLDAALEYAARGIPVFPLIPRDKKPVIPKDEGGNGYKDATTDPDLIRKWWRRWPRANIGIPTGKSSGWVVVDIDPRNGGNYDGLAAMGNLPKTLTAQTGSGGLHLVFAYPFDLEAKIAQGVEKLGDGLDVKADGGYICAAPSIHPNGNPYEWVTDAPAAALPTWIIKRLTAKAKTASAEPLATGKTPAAAGATDDDGTFWLKRALERTADGVGDSTGFWLAQQLCASAVPNPEQVLAEYAARATLNPQDPFDERSVARWLSSARQSRIGSSGEPARNQNPVSLQTLTTARTTANAVHAVSAARPALRFVSSADAEDAAQPDPATGPRFRFLSDEEVEHMPAPEWLVHNILPEARLSVVYGEFGSCKSFLALDWALCVATGQAWQGHVVKQGLVAYIAGEGIGGMGKRIRAWKQHHGVSGSVPLRVLGDAPQLLEPTDVAELVVAMESLETSPKLVIIDTLARSTVGGEENSARDMGVAVAAAERIRKQFDAHVLIIHHKPKSANSTRGSTALPGAADTLIDVVKDGDTLELTCPKQKDSANFEPIQLTTLVRALDEHADETSLVLVTPEAGVGGTLNGSQRQALEALRDNFFDDGATSGDWLKVYPGKERNFYNAVKALTDAGYVRRVGSGRSVRYEMTTPGHALLQTAKSLQSHCNADDITNCNTATTPLGVAVIAVSADGDEKGDEVTLKL